MLHASFGSTKVVDEGKGKIKKKKTRKIHPGNRKGSEQDVTKSNSLR